MPHWKGSTRRNTMMRVLLCAVLLMGVGGAYADNEWMYQPPARSVVYRLNVDVADADMTWMRPPPARSVVYRPVMGSSTEPVGGFSRDPGLIDIHHQVLRDGFMVSNSCSTPAGSCSMATYWPIIGTCWCVGPSGPVQGTPGG